jgi:hypothetical protein
MLLKLILGCWGRENIGLIMCPSVENQILDLTKKTEQNILISDYLDNVYHLFDKPLKSNVHTAIYNIQQKFSTLSNDVFQKKYFLYLEEFCYVHTKCGLYLKLKLEKVNHEKGKV